VPWPWARPRPARLRALAVYQAVVPAIVTASGDPLPAVGAAFAVTRIAAAFAWLGTVGWAVARAPFLAGPRARLAFAAALAATGIALSVVALA
jgi:hypothetical protein